MRGLCTTTVVLLLSGAAYAQPALTEPPEFPQTRPGPSATQTGEGCFLLASGRITPGDVDWMSITVPRQSTRTIVDVDFPVDPNNPNAGSALVATVVGGGSGFNQADNNASRDNFCGLGASSNPAGSMRDSAVDLLGTPLNAVIDIGVSGAGDSAFTGNHNHTFHYEVWVYVVPVSCTSDGDCADSVACTIDTCDTATGVCSRTPSDAVCDDGRFCNGPERCDTVLGCRLGPPPVCNDGVSCTINRCDQVTDECTFEPDDGYCHDGVFCNGDEWCDSQLDCQDGEPVACDDDVPCTSDSCDEEVGGCVFVPDDTQCDNGRFCDGVEACDPFAGCVAGPRPACNDGVSCTTDGCDMITDRCVHLPSDAACDNGLRCDGVETCDPANGCRPGTPMNCGDGVPCTVDTCSEANGCQHLPDDSRCSNGSFCDGVETCDAVQGCLAGEEVDCDDGVDCTVDSCDDASGGCVHDPDHGFCGGGEFCEGGGFCDPETGCQGGDGPVCDDGVVCTVDECDLETGECIHKPNDSACNDELFCNGKEKCDAEGGCVSGEHPCADQFCDEEKKRCVECFEDADCDDGEFCNGAETCHEEGKCQTGKPPCSEDEVCNADAEACEPKHRGPSLDIRPGECPNPLAVRGTGQWAAALAGNAGFDVRQVDPASLVMTRADGVGGKVVPSVPMEGKRPRYRDVATPFSGELCGCHMLEDDGVKDLVMRFDNQQVVSALKLGNLPTGASVTLRVTGRLRNGTTFEAADCVVVRNARMVQAPGPGRK